MTSFRPPLFDELTFLSPLSEQRAGDLVDFLGGTDAGRVVDIGCGWAELLLRVLAAQPSLRGLGIDKDAAYVRHGQSLAKERGLEGRVTLVTGDASKETPRADAVICIGASQVWGEHDFVELPYAAAVAALRAMVPLGGRVVYGEAIWSQPPTEAAAAALGGSLREFVTMADLVAIAVDAGFRPYGIGEATLDEWDDFESGFGRAHEGSAGADAHREGWLRGYRGVLGMAYLRLIAS